MAQENIYDLEELRDSPARDDHRPEEDTLQARSANGQPQTHQDGGASPDLGNQTDAEVEINFPFVPIGFVTEGGNNYLAGTRNGVTELKPILTPNQLPMPPTPVQYPPQRQARVLQTPREATPPQMPTPSEGNGTIEDKDYMVPLPVDLKNRLTSKDLKNELAMIKNQAKCPPGHNASFYQDWQEFLRKVWSSWNGYKWPNNPETTAQFVTQYMNLLPITVDPNCTFQTLLHDLTIATGVTAPLSTEMNNPYTFEFDTQSSLVAQIVNFKNKAQLYYKQELKYSDEKVMTPLSALIHKSKFGLAWDAVKLNTANYKTVSITQLAKAAEQQATYPTIGATPGKQLPTSILKLNPQGKEYTNVKERVKENRCTICRQNHPEINCLWAIRYRQKENTFTPPQDGKVAKRYMCAIHGAVHSHETQSCRTVQELAAFYIERQGILPNEISRADMGLQPRRGRPMQTQKPDRKRQREKHESYKPRQRGQQPGKPEKDFQQQFNQSMQMFIMNQQQAMYGAHQQQPMAMIPQKVATNPQQAVTAKQPAASPQPITAPKAVSWGFENKSDSEYQKWVVDINLNQLKVLCSYISNTKNIESYENIPMDIGKPMEFYTKLGHIPVIVCIDSGAGLNAISLKFLIENRDKIEILAEKTITNALEITVGDGNITTGSEFKCIQMGTKDKIPLWFLVLENLPVPALLGSPAITRLKGEMKDEKVSFFGREFGPLIKGSSKIHLTNMKPMKRNDNHQHASDDNHQPVKIKTTIKAKIPPRTIKMVKCQIPWKSQQGYFMPQNTHNGTLYVKEGLVEADKNGIITLPLANMSSKKVTLKPSSIIGKVLYISQQDVRNTTLIELNGKSITDLAKVSEKKEPEVQKKVEIESEETLKMFWQMIDENKDVVEGYLKNTDPDSVSISTDNFDQRLLIALTKPLDQKKPPSHLEEVYKKFNLQDTQLPPNEKEELAEMINKYKTLWSKEVQEGPLKRTTTTTCDIQTEGPPLRSNPRRTDPVEDQIIWDHINSMAARNVIRPSKSPWAAPIMLADKKNGKVRFCVDYRRLNAVTKQDAYPLPRMDDILNSLGKSSIFSTLDQSSAFWSIPITEEDIEKTAFTSKYGLWEFLSMPFGLTNAPPTQQRFIESVLTGLLWKSCFAYIDDILCYSDTFQDHKRDLEEIFKRFIKHGIYLQPDKCSFCKTSFEILGMVATKDGIKPNPKKVQAIKDYPIPRSKKELESFLGIISWLRRFIPQCTKKTYYLRKASVEDGPYPLPKAAEEEFENLKITITSDIILGHPQLNKQFYIHVDASQKGLGVILTQLDKDGKHRRIEYASKSLNPSQQKYSSPIREALGILWSLLHFKYYIVGRKPIIYTDCDSLRALFKPGTTKMPEHVSLRDWAARILQYNPRIVHKPGKEMLIPDALSRHYLKYSTEKEEVHKQAIQEMVALACKYPLAKLASRQEMVLKKYGLDDMTVDMTSGLYDQEGGRNRTACQSVTLNHACCTKSSHVLANLAGIEVKETQRPPPKVTRANSNMRKDLPYHNEKGRSSPNMADPSRALRAPKHQDDPLLDSLNKATIMMVVPLIEMTPTLIQEDQSQGPEDLHKANYPQDKDDEGNATNPLAKLAVYQRTDQELVEIIDFLNKGQLPDNRNQARYVRIKAKNYALDKDGILRREPSQRITTTQKTAQAALPRCLWELTMTQYHDSPISGHRKFRKLLAAISDKYHFTGMRTYIKMYCKTCLKCNMTTVTKAPTAPMQPIQASYPGVLVHIDCAKGNKETPRGNLYIIAIIDSFTGYLSLYASPQPNAEETANAVLQYISIHSMPLRIVSDNGSEFVNDLVVELARVLGLKHNFIAPYNSKANGKVENSHKQTEGMLRTYMDKFAKDWDILIPYIQFAINTSKSEVTNYTPFYLHFGRHPIMPLDAYLESPHMPSFTVSKYVKEIHENRQKVFDWVALRKKEVSEKSATRYNKKHKTTMTTFEEGDTVMLRNKTKSTDMGKKYKPLYHQDIYIIDEVMGNGCYKLRDLKRQKPAFPVNVSLLKKTQLRHTIDLSASKDTITVQETNSEEKEIEEEQFEIKRIVSHKDTKEGRYYKVQWKGYSNKHNTFVHEKALNASELLTEYNQKK
jgi:transposase InsO family protein